MRDVFGQVRAEVDVHRPTNAHLTFHRQVLVLGDQRIAAIGPDQIF